MKMAISLPSSLKRTIFVSCTVEIFETIARDVMGMGLTVEESAECVIVRWAPSGIITTGEHTSPPPFHVRHHVTHFIREITAESCGRLGDCKAVGYKILTVAEISFETTRLYVHARPATPSAIGSATPSL